MTLHSTIPSRIITAPFKNRHVIRYKHRCPIHGCVMSHIDSAMACCPECGPKENIWYMGMGRAIQFTEEVKKRGEQIFGEGGRM